MRLDSQRFFPRPPVSVIQQLLIEKRKRDTHKHHALPAKDYTHCSYGVGDRGSNQAIGMGGFIISLTSNHIRYFNDMDIL
jgi:hypothetical protein